MIPKKNFSLTKIKKILLQRGYVIYKKQRKNLNQDSKNIFFVFCISLLLITIFGILPKSVKFINKEFYSSKTIENNSKKNFEKVLSGKELELKPALINKAISVAHKGNYQNIADDMDTLESILNSAGKL